MNPVVPYSVVVIAGLVGAVAMEVVMWLIKRTGWTQGSMLVALGSLITRRRSNAWLVGALIHLLSAVVFAFFYTQVLGRLGLTVFPQAQIAGAAMGFIQGLIVSIALVWVVAEQHPLEEFSKAGFQVGVTHIAGHVAFGLAVGLVMAAT